LGGGILAPTTDLNIEETMVGMFVLTLLWMDSIVVIDKGRFVVKRPLPRVIAAGCAWHISIPHQIIHEELAPVTGPSNAKLRVTSTEVIWFITLHDSVAVPQLSPPGPCTQFCTYTLLGTCAWATSYQAAIKYASRSPIISPGSVMLFDIADVGTSPLLVEVEKVTDWEQSVTETGTEPSPDSTVEQMAEDVRV
jgi:hypothetical protein